MVDWKLLISIPLHFQIKCARSSCKKLAIKYVFQVIVCMTSKEQWVNRHCRKLLLAWLRRVPHHSDRRVLHHTGPTAMDPKTLHCPSSQRYRIHKVNMKIWLDYSAIHSAQDQYENNQIIRLYRRHKVNIKISLTCTGHYEVLGQLLWCWDQGPVQCKESLSRYGDSHIKDKTVARPSYL